MRITISKETTEANMVRQVHSAIQMAKDCAKNGITSFKFSVRTDSGFNKHELVRRVARSRRMELRSCSNILYKARIMDKQLIIWALETCLANVDKRETSLARRINEEINKINNTKI